MASHGKTKRKRLTPDFKTLFNGFCLMACILFIISGYVAVPWLSDIQDSLKSFAEDQSVSGMLFMGVCYAMLLAIPFVPAVELGILIMILFGNSGIVFAYVCTLAGLLLSYFIGWFVCRHHVARTHSGEGGNDSVLQVPEKIRLTRAFMLLNRACPRFLIENRYVSIALLINMPGNIALGGGGGIAMFCGASSRFRLPKFILTVAIAISPLPLLMLVGSGF